jgi:tripartite-type tricarboxylate transporter receptor subunit TctC
MVARWSQLLGVQGQIPACIACKKAYACKLGDEEINMLKRRDMLAAASLASLALPSVRAQSQTAKLLIGAPPGGAGDTFLRKIAEKLRGSYASSAVVENKPGAGGQIALMGVRDAAPDGLTMLMSPSTFFSVYPHTYAKLPYKEGDFTPVSLLAHTNFGLAVGPAVPASVKNLREFLAWCSANPDKATYGSPAAGSVPHLVVAALAHRENSPLRHIPYRGSVPGIQDMRGGTLAAMSSPIGALLPHLPAGIRVLAVTGNARSPLLPDVPIYADFGLALNGREWFGMFLPGAAKPDVVAKLSSSLREILAQKDLIDAGAALGLEVASSTPAQLQGMIRADNEEWKVWVKRIGFTAES